MAAVRQLRPDAKLLLLGLLPRAPRSTGASLRPDKNYFVERLKAVNDNARLLAASDPALKYLDAWDLFTVEKNGQVHIEVDKMPDLLHPSHKGMRAWGARVRDRVSQMLLASPLSLTRRADP